MPRQADLSVFPRAASCDRSTSLRPDVWTPFPGARHHRGPCFFFPSLLVHPRWGTFLISLAETPVSPPSGEEHRELPRFEDLSSPASWASTTRRYHARDYVTYGGAGLATARINFCGNINGAFKIARFCLDLRTPEDTVWNN